MSVRILVGDCREHLRTLANNGEQFDCGIIDPPYGETSLEWDRYVPELPALLLPLIRTTGSIWVFGSMRMFLENADDFEGWRLAQDVVWEKHNGSGFAADRFKRVHEHALHFYRSDAAWGGVYKQPQFTNDATARVVKKRGQTVHTGKIKNHTDYRTVDGGPRLMRSVMFARSEHSRAVHPTQKPITIVEPLLLYSCPPGGSVLDPMAGSGTVGVVAQRHGREATLIEANPEYQPVIESRLVDLFAGTQEGKR